MVFMLEKVHNIAHIMYLATPVCLDVRWKSVVWNYDTFKNNSRSKHALEIYLKEISSLVSYQYFLFKCFLRIACVRAISQTESSD